MSARRDASWSRSAASRRSSSSSQPRAGPTCCQIGSPGSERRGCGQGDPFVAHDPAADGVAGGEGVIEPGVQIGHRGEGLLAAELCVGPGQSLDEGLGRRLGPALLLDLGQQAGEVRRVVEPDRLGGLDLDLPEPGLLEAAQVVAPDEVVGVLGRELADDPDPHPQRRALHRQSPMLDEQVLDRLFLRIGFVEEARRLDHQPRRGGQPVDPDQLIPLGPLAEVQDRDHIEQPRLRLRELDGLRAEALLQQPLATPEPLVDLAARGGIVGRELLHPLVPRLVARLHDPADLVDDLVVVGHRTPRHVG